MNTPSPQEAGVVHHNFCAALRIEKEVARDAVGRRRHTGNNGQVIGIGKGGDNRFGCGKNPLLAEMLQGREEAAVETILEIGGIATIDADNDRRIVWRLVRPTVYRDGWHTSPFSVVAYVSDFCPCSMPTRPCTNQRCTAKMTSTGGRSAGMAAAIIIFHCAHLS